MPTLYYHVESTGVNILKSVTDEVVYGLLEELDLSRSFKNGVYIMSSFMASSNFSNAEGATTMVRNRCDVDVSYVMDKAQVPWPVETPYTTTAYGRRTTQRGTHTPILIDKKAGILIEHETVACALEMDFTLTFTTFDEACKALDSIESRYRGSLIQTPFHLAFSYPISFELFKYLITAFQAKADYKDKKFLDWLNDTKQTQISFDVRKSQLDQVDADKELMVRCQQLNCLLQVTMEQKEPDVSRIEQLPDAYKLSFRAVIQFGRPNLICVHTPISIDNTVLPEALFTSVTRNTHYSPEVSGVYQDLICSEYMRRSYGNFNHAHQLVRVPEYDDWLSIDKQYEFYQYRPFLVQHFTLDGPTTIINLSQLGDISLHPIVQTILKEMKNDVLDYGGIFHLGIYAGDLRLDKDLVTIDDDLNVTITSNRQDKVYHLMISETTQLSKMSVAWDRLLIKYRYFFPLTIERNLEYLIKKRYFTASFDDSFLTLIARLSQRGKVKALLADMIAAGEVTQEIYSYTQNPSQLADFLAYTQSCRKDYQIPTGDDEISRLIQAYYRDKASVYGRSLLTVFIEHCLIKGYLTLDNVPDQYIQPSRSVFPYYSGQGGYYGFNTPLRTITFALRT